MSVYRCPYHFQLSEEKLSQVTAAVMEYFFSDITSNILAPVLLFDYCKMYSLKHSQNHNVALYPIPVQ